MGSPRRPAPLRRGDVIAIVAPAGPVDRRRLLKGLSRLSALGFVPETAEGILAKERYLAGDDDHRAAQMEWAFTLPEARAVMAARGGYGAARLLPLLDWVRIARRPKLLVGYSDLTAILSYLATRHGVPCVHGPMAAADVAFRRDPEAMDAFSRLCAGEAGPGEPWGSPCVPLRRGTAEGTLAGGCLSVLTSLLGTPYEPDFRGTLLFLEDVSEPAYRLDRMLTQWVQSGRWKGIAGIVAGRMEPAKGESEEDLARLFAEAGRALSVPAWYGYPAGHGPRNWPIPFGVPARLDGKGRLFLLGSPVERE